MLRIGVLADSHIRDLKRGLEFFGELAARFLDNTEMILHAGDLVNPDILLAFSDKPVYAVRGNMDPPTLDLPDRRIIEAQGFRIGLIHGWGQRGGLEEKLSREFQGQSLDCLVYGHSHRPACHVKDGMLFFNPGSCTDRRGAPCHTVGILELGKTIGGHIISIDP
jgi:putative phosphoesterase